MNGAARRWCTVHRSLWLQHRLGVSVGGGDVMEEERRRLRLQQRRLTHGCAFCGTVRQALRDSAGRLAVHRRRHHHHHHHHHHSLRTARIRAGPLLPARCPAASQSNKDLSEYPSSPSPLVHFLPAHRRPRPAAGSALLLLLLLLVLNRTNPIQPPSTSPHPPIPLPPSDETQCMYGRPNRSKT
ncbi:hypothetical protein F2P81_018845 [Scophthalmus maximus]|uniref:Uncharacterized protein n=1 Tax=Scophthalmus maximus TaxID=52904 RepID=A0A6A4SD82_SCOMX|nr:hypothetical protein F2P81_018845 [Scophthalmus maximus]